MKMIQHLLVALAVFLLAGVILNLVGVAFAWTIALVIGIVVFLGGWSGHF